MAPTPYMQGLLRLSYQYTISSHPNESSFFIRPDNTTLATGVKRADNTIVTFQQCAELYVGTLLAPFFLTTQDFNSYQFHQYLGTAWVPITSGDPNFGGTAASGTEKWATVVTMVMRDSARKFVRHMVFETIQPAPASLQHGDTLPQLVGYVAEMFPAANNTTDAGNVVVSRAGNAVTTFVGWSIAQSRRIRRERGYL